jgi:hypothetical protein
MSHSRFHLNVTYTETCRSRNSAAGIATGYVLDDKGVGVRVKNFLFCTSSRPALELTQPLIKWVPEAFSPGVKRPGRESDHSPPASAEFKTMWIYTSTPPYAFIEYCLISSAQGPLLNPSSLTVALGSNQPLTEMYNSWRLKSGGRVRLTTSPPPVSL